MKFRSSAFTADTCKLSFIDVIRLLMGKQIQDGALVVGLWSMPLNEEERRRGYPKPIERA